MDVGPGSVEPAIIEPTPAAVPSSASSHAALSTPQSSQPQAGLARYLPLLALLVILVGVAAIRYRFLETPLERDEGEFAYGGQLILSGERPYTSMYAMKLPGIYLAYALLEATFGQTVFAIHFGLLLVNLACITLIYALGRKMLGGMTGAVGAAIFALMTLSPGVQGTQTQAEHFVILFALLGLLCLLRESHRSRVLFCFVSGLAFGLAVLCKQHGFVFPLFGLAYLVLREPARWKQYPLQLLGEMAALSVGCLVPWLICCAVFIATGTLEDFLFWTFTYPSQYVSLVRPINQVKLVVPAVTDQLSYVGVFWLAALAGVSALFWFGPARHWRTCLLLLLLFCFWGITPGGYYRQHYFIFLAPPLALLAAIGWQGLATAYRQQGGGWVLPIVLLLMIFAWPTWKLASFYAPLDAKSLSAALYRGCPFRDAPAISKYLEEHTSPTDHIAILGSEPEILFYAKRRSATGHIYMYPLTEPHPYALKLQKQVIDEIEAAQPKYIVYVSYLNSWFSKRGADTSEFQKWMDSYLTDRYYTIGVIENILPDKTVTHWGDEIKELHEISAHSLVIHKRR